MIVNVVIIASI